MQKRYIHLHKGDWLGVKLPMVRNRFIIVTCEVVSQRARGTSHMIIVTITSVTKYDGGDYLSLLGASHLHASLCLSLVLTRGKLLMKYTYTILLISSGDSLRYLGPVIHV